MPMRRRSGLSSLSRWIFAISRPSNKMLPSVGSIIRLMQRSTVDLPAPEGPMMTTSSPRSTSKLTSSTALVGP